MDAENIERRRREKLTNTSSSESDTIVDMHDRMEIDDRGQTFLCFLILSCIKHIYGYNSIPDKKKLRGKAKITDKETRASHVKSLTTTVLPFIPQLLNVFHADIAKIYPVVQMIPLIPMQAYEMIDGKQHMTDILNNLKEIFIKHEILFTDNTSEYIIDDSISDVVDSDDEDQIVEKQASRIKNTLDKIHIQIKKQISFDLYLNIAKVFGYLCGIKQNTNEHDEEHQFVNECQRFVFQLSCEMVDEFQQFFEQLQKIMHKNAKNQNTKKISDLLQSLFSCLKRMCALKKIMKINVFSFDKRMNTILKYVMDGKLFDTKHYEITRVLLNILQMDIIWDYSVLSFTEPDLEAISAVDGHKTSILLFLEYFVTKVYVSVMYYLRMHVDEDDEEDEDILPLAEVREILHIICTIMESCGFFQYVDGQSQMLNNIFTSYNLLEIENKIFDKLLNICKLAFLLPIKNDPYGPSPIICKSLGNQYLYLCIKLVKCNPLFFGKFGGLFLTQYHKTDVIQKCLHLEKNGNKKNISKKNENSEDITQNGIIHEFLRIQIKNKNFVHLQIMYFYAMRDIMNDKSLVVSVRYSRFEYLCKSFALCRGMQIVRSNYFEHIILLLLNYILLNIDIGMDGAMDSVANMDVSVPVGEYFIFLGPVLCFLQRSLNRDKIRIWSLFLMMEKKLPEKKERKGGQWIKFNEFRVKFGNLSRSAKRKRNINVEDEEVLPEMEDLFLSPERKSDVIEDGRGSKMEDGMDEEMEDNVGSVDDDGGGREQSKKMSVSVMEVKENEMDEEIEEEMDEEMDEEMEEIEEKKKRKVEKGSQKISASRYEPSEESSSEEDID